MKNIALFIPAQETNKYHKWGDLAPFGDTTLLQWKLSQCKLFSNADNIFISSNSSKIKKIAKNEGVNFIERIDGSMEDQIRFYSNEIKNEIILWTNATAPFLGDKDYLKICQSFNSKKFDLMLTVVEKKDYAFFKRKKINFKNDFIDRSTIEPINLCTNGAFVFESKLLTKHDSILDANKISLYKLNDLSSLEIKDITDYSLSKELITAYFREFYK